uniref:Uncharacterized protein n=1 Tax=Oryza brachyantha TaxID=4533 RepID=J3NAK2_ORYBR
PIPPSFSTWQTYIVKSANAWHRVRAYVPPHYPTTVTINQLTALKMLHDFVSLTLGVAALPLSNFYVMLGTLMLMHVSLFCT